MQPVSPSVCLVARDLPWYGCTGGTDLRGTAYQLPGIIYVKCPTLALTCDTGTYLEY